MREEERTEKQKIERQFIAWALARDDDWWQEGHGSVSIWDVRIMIDFFYPLLRTAIQQERAIYLKRVKNLEAELVDGVGFNRIAELVRDLVPAPGGSGKKE